MTTQTYILCAVAGLLGMLFHIFAIKLQSAQTRAKAANIKLTVADFLSTEIAGIASTVVMLGILLLVLPEALKYKPDLANWLKIIFAFCGFTGSSILLAIFGKVSGQINKVVDIKTDVSDQKISAEEGAIKLNALDAK